MVSGVNFAAASATAGQASTSPVGKMPAAHAVDLPGSQRRRHNVCLYPGHVPGVAISALRCRCGWIGTKTGGGKWKEGQSMPPQKPAHSAVAHHRSATNQRNMMLEMHWVVRRSRQWRRRGACGRRPSLASCLRLGAGMPRPSLHCTPRNRPQT